MDKSFLILLNLSKSDLRDSKALSSYLIESGAKPEQQKLVLEIFELKRKTNKQATIVKRFIEVSAVPFTEDKEKILKYKDLYSHLKFVEDVPIQNPLRLLLELSIALRTENKEWVRKLAKRIVNTSDLQFASYIEPRVFTNKIYLQYVEALFDTLNLMKIKKFDPMLVRMIATRLTFFLPTKEKTRFTSFFNANWSLNELREFVKSREYGQSGVGLWFNVLENRTTKQEVNNFLNGVLKKSAIKRMAREEFWVFKYFYPGDDRRELLDKRLASYAKKSTSIHDRLILSEILEKEAIQKTLSKIDKTLARPLFKIKRDVYQEVLRSGLPSQFALYNLFLLGEKDTDLFWWYVL